MSALRLKPGIDLKIAPRHGGGRKALFEPRPDRSAVQQDGPPGGLHGFVHRIHQIAGHPVLDDLGRGAAAERHHRRAAGHGLDHHQTERLGPVDGEQQRLRPAEKGGLLGVADLAHELHQGIVQQRPDLVCRNRCGRPGPPWPPSSGAGPGGWRSRWPGPAASPATCGQGRPDSRSDFGENWYSSAGMPCWTVACQLAVGIGRR